ncbi:MAG: prolyl oligopeptidase family serine peptidase, partial [Paramuribaculum sp.]|nr:prolyl oligopeptidase family serine peptidase [Paramuribaculum sp.]
SNGKIIHLPLGHDIIKGISLPDGGVNAAFCAQSMDNPDRLYTFNTKTLKSSLLDEPLAADLADVKLGKVEPWSFVNSRGDSIHGRFYLPPNFDPNEKYPMIVNYYGGCSPTSRNFESRYPHHAYAAQGYVVYVIEPSGATGFGQEFSSRHVNTAGEGVAQDIIEGTKRFCEEHPYVDSTKIGCIGASYGGFMTQYLQTVTDIFAAAISHAGISDHTSYWGEGYWGYSYSEVSMADSYPWSDTELYVKQSPLYNADKIHTPLLFLHGDADNNVPVGESIQMFTALKLLDRPTAFVAVKDQDHHILDYDKRIRWQDTIFAWFAKYLKDQPQWWESMYPEVSL